MFRIVQNPLLCDGEAITRHESMQSELLYSLVEEVACTNVLEKLAWVCHLSVRVGREGSIPDKSTTMEVLLVPTALLH